MKYGVKYKQKEREKERFLRKLSLYHEKYISAFWDKNLTNYPFFDMNRRICNDRFHSYFICLFTDNPLLFYEKTRKTAQYIKCIDKHKKMTQTFRLKKGQISFAENRILISDNAKSQKSMSLLTNGIILIWGIMNIFKFEQLGDEFFLSFWIVLVILLLIVFVAVLLESTKSVILFVDIKSIRVKQRSINTILYIKLRNNQLRRVMQIEDDEEIKKFINKYRYDLEVKR